MDRHDDGESRLLADLTVDHQAVRRWEARTVVSGFAPKRPSTVSPAP